MSFQAALASVAQWIEQLGSNESVGGSTPSGGTLPKKKERFASFPPLVLTILPYELLIFWFFFAFSRDVFLTRPLFLPIPA